MNRVVSILALSLLICCLSAPSFAAEKEWTFMVFLNADNNLDSFGVDDMKEMSLGGGSNEWRNVVCLLDRENGPATLNYIEKDGPVLLKDMGEMDMGDYNAFVNFVTETAKAYPAKHYCAIIWNHGSGWKDINGETIKGISYDDSSGNHITTAQLTLATAAIAKNLGKKLDILCFDACLMQMIEVAYAMKETVGILVASEETEPGEGYCYDDMLNNVKKGMNPVAFAKVLVEQYAKSYSGGSAGSSSTTQSAVDCTKLDALKDAIDGFSKASMAGVYSAQFKDVLSKVQKFYYRTNVDLLHLSKLLKGAIKDDAFQTAVSKLEGAYAQAVVANGTSGTSMKNASGIAIYFPSSSYSFSAAYNDLAFAQESMWDEMVQDYYKKITAPAIVAEVEKGDLSGLVEYVQMANSNNREISSDLVAKLNFRVFTEGGLPSSTQETVRTLVTELKTK